MANSMRQFFCGLIIQGVGGDGVLVMCSIVITDTT